MDKTIREYFARIGKVGGQRSKRKLSPESAKKMVCVREARRAFKKYQSRCFWSFDPEYRVTINDVDWVAEQLMKHGDREAWLLGSKLCL